MIAVKIFGINHLKNYVQKLDMSFKLIYFTECAINLLWNVGNLGGRYSCYHKIYSKITEKLQFDSISYLILQKNGSFTVKFTVFR